MSQKKPSRMERPSFVQPTKFQQHPACIETEYAMPGFYDTLRRYQDEDTGHWSCPSATQPCGKAKVTDVSRQQGLEHSEWPSHVMTADMGMSCVQQDSEPIFLKETGEQDQAQARCNRSHWSTSFHPYIDPPCPTQPLKRKKGRTCCQCRYKKKERAQLTSRCSQKRKNIFFKKNGNKRKRKKLSKKHIKRPKAFLKSYRRPLYGAHISKKLRKKDHICSRKKSQKRKMLRNASKRKKRKIRQQNNSAKRPKPGVAKRKKTSGKCPRRKRSPPQRAKNRTAAVLKGFRSNGSFLVPGPRQNLIHLTCVKYDLDAKSSPCCGVRSLTSQGLRTGQTFNKPSKCNHTYSCILLGRVASWKNGQRKRLYSRKNEKDKSLVQCFTKCGSAMKEKKQGRLGLKAAQMYFLAVIVRPSRRNAAVASPHQSVARQKLCNLYASPLL